MLTVSAVAVDFQKKHDYEPVTGSWWRIFALVDHEYSVFVVPVDMKLLVCSLYHLYYFCIKFMRSYMKYIAQGNIIKDGSLGERLNLRMICHIVILDSLMRESILRKK
jgi:hypothetical protein